MRRVSGTRCELCRLTAPTRWTRCGSPYQLHACYVLVTRRDRRVKQVFRQRTLTARSPFPGAINTVVFMAGWDGDEDAVVRVPVTDSGFFRHGC